MCLDHLDGPAFRLVLGVQGLVVVAIHVLEARCSARIEERPLRIRLNALHEEIGDPHGVKEVPGTEVLVALVTFEVQEAHYIGVVRLDVDRTTSLAFAALREGVAWRLVRDGSHGRFPWKTYLIDVVDDFVGHLEHRDESVACAVGALDQRPFCPDT